MKNDFVVHNQLRSFLNFMMTSVPDDHSEAPENIPEELFKVADDESTHTDQEGTLPLQKQNPEFVKDLPQVIKSFIISTTGRSISETRPNSNNGNESFFKERPWEKSFCADGSTVSTKGVQTLFETFKAITADVSPDDVALFPDNADGIPGNADPPSDVKDQKEDGILKPNELQEATYVSSKPPIEIISRDPARKSNGGSSMENILAQEEGSNGAEIHPEVIAEPPIEYDAAGQLPIGTKLGHFQITGYVGGGGMGNVYEGVDKALDRKVAIKVLAKERAKEQASVARFLNEARSAARLNHEYIAQVYYCGEVRGIPFIAFEYVEGINVRSYIMEHGRIPYPQAVNFIMQMAGALEHASGHGVTHRDVKPSNILITPQGNAKLIDMGLARLLRQSDQEDDLTASGVTLGTFDYISPEQALDPRNADVRSDIYSLGCTFFYMLTGQPPFAEGTVLQKLLKHQGDEPPHVRSFVSDIPVEIDDVILKMMAKNPKNRFQTPLQLIDCLNEIAEKIGLQPGIGRNVWEYQESNVKKSFFRHLPWVISLILLFVFIFILRQLTDHKQQNLLPSLSPVFKQNVSMTERPAVENKIPMVPEKEKFSIPIVPSVNTVVLLQENDLNKIGFSKIDSDFFNQTSANSFTLAASERSCGGLGIKSVSSDYLTEDLSADIPDKKLLSSVARLLGSLSPDNIFVWSRGSVSSGSSENKISGVGNSSLAPRYIIDNIGEKPGTWSSIQAALNAVQNLPDTENEQGEIILDLQFNGTLAVPLLSFSGRKIKITAAPQFQPLLQFQPGKSVNDSGECFFLLKSTELTLENIALDLVVPVREVLASDWTVFEMREGSSLSLKNTSITVDNSVDEKNYPGKMPQACFFRVNPIQSVFSGKKGSVSSDRPSFSILMDNCFLRGEADALLCRQTCGGRFDIKNSLLNISGSLVHYEENDRQDTNKENLLLGINSSALLLNKHLILHEQGENPNRLFPMRTVMNNSILYLKDSPLVCSVSDIPKTELEDASKWTIEQSVLLNVSGYRRHREYRNLNSYSDEPLVNNISLRLESFSLEASEIVNSTKPHLFIREQFNSLLFYALANSANEDVKKTVRKLKEKMFSSSASAPSERIKKSSAFFSTERDLL